MGAIDFGTSYSGYAFSSKDRPTDIVNRKWEASSRALVSEKTPTCILFDGNKNFQAFGYEAKDGYAEYCESQLQTECYFFENYKMALFDKMVSNFIWFMHRINRIYHRFLIQTEKSQPEGKRIMPETR